MIKEVIEYISFHVFTLESDELFPLDAGENLFANYYPDTPDVIVSVIDAGGSPPQKYSPIREKIFEIKFRCNNHSDGVGFGNQILDMFHNKENYQLGSFFILSSSALTDVTYLYADSNKRDEFTFNISFLIKI